MRKTRTGRPWRAMKVAVLLGSLAMAPHAGANTPPAGDSTTAEYYEDAKARFAEGDYEGTVIQLKNVLQAQPDNAAARTLIGRAYVELGDGATAEKELGLALEVRSDDTPIAVPLGQALIMQHKYRALLGRIRPGERGPEIETKIHMLRGLAYVALRQLDAAEREYGAAKALNVDNTNALLGLAEVAVYRGETEAAEARIAEALRQAPENADAWSLDGDYKRGQGDLPGAIASYGRALTIEPLQIDARRSRAAALIDLNRIEEARKDVDYLIELLPGDPQTIYLHALILGRNGEGQRAKAELHRADNIIRTYDMTFVRDNLPTLLTAGVINFALREVEDALVYLDQYLKLEPGHIGARRMLASLYVQQRKHRRAVRVLGPIIGPNTRNPRLLAQFGTALMRIGEHAEASRIFEQAIALAPDLAQIRTRLALNEFAAGNAETAIAGLQAALDRDADAVENTVILGLMHLRQRDYARALSLAEDLGSRDPDNPFAPNLAGAAHWGQGDEDAARSSFEAAIGIDADYTPAHINLAKLDIRGGDLEAAEKRLLSLIDRGLVESEPFEALASIAERRGKLPEAIAWLERTERTSADGPRIQIQLINLHIRAGNHQQSIALARRLEAANPDNLAVVEAFSRAAIAAGDSDVARIKLRRTVELAWKSPRELHRIARLQQAIGDNEGAYTSLWRAVSVNPANLEAQASLVRLEVSRGELDKALQRAETVRGLNPEVATGDLLAGDVLMSAGRHAEAVAAYEAGLKKQDDGALMLRLYVAQRKAQSGASHAAMLEKWLERHPDDSVVKRALAGEFARLGRLDEAIALNETLLEGQPDDPVVLNNLAWLYQKTGNPKARAFAQRAYDLAPNQARTIDTLGWILVQEGDVNRGLTLLRFAQSRAPDDPSVNFHIAVALSKLGRTDDAKAQLETVLSGAHDEDIAAQAEALLKQLSGG